MINSKHIKYKVKKKMFFFLLNCKIKIFMIKCKKVNFVDYQNQYYFRLYH